MNRLGVWQAAGPVADLDCDVAVAGAGLGGMAAAIFLRQAGTLAPVR